MGTLERNRGDFYDNCSADQNPKSLLRPGSYGSRFSMSKNIFADIKQFLRLWDFPIGYENNADTVKWLPIRDFIEAFNHHQVNKIRPRKFVVCDEVMSAWEGQEDKYSVEGLLGNQEVSGWR